MTICVKTSTSKTAGSCNCCDEHTTEEGSIDEHTVAILTAGYGNHSMSLRFCEKCFASLRTLVWVAELPKLARHLSCPICATIVEYWIDGKGKRVVDPDECEWCKKKRPRWRSVHHPRFGLKGD